MLLALLLGLSMHFLYKSPRHQPGVDFCSKSLLRIALGLLSAYFGIRHCLFSYYRILNYDVLYANDQK